MTYRLCALVGVAVLGSGLALAAVDNFNRPNGPLGADWTAVSGTWRIENNMARSSTGAATDLAIYNALQTANALVGADVFYLGGSRITYAALVSGYTSASNTVFIKVQDNNGNGDFERVFFYFGNNGSPWPGMTGGPSFVDVTPFTQARLWTVLSGNSITLNIDRDMNGVPEDVLTRGGLPSLGTSGGLGGYSNAAFDNFVMTPEPASLALLAAVALLRRR